jgi:hypothetical protein
LLQNVLLFLPLMKCLLLALITFQCTYNLKAQINIDTSRLIYQTSAVRVLMEDPTLQEKSHFKEWIIPSTMVLYGLLTTHIDAFTDLDEDTKYVIWNQYPHQTVNIDDYLQFAPALWLSMD